MLVSRLLKPHFDVHCYQHPGCIIIAQIFTLTWALRPNSNRKPLTHHPLNHYLYNSNRFPTHQAPHPNHQPPVFNLIKKIGPFKLIYRTGLFVLVTAFFSKIKKVTLYFSVKTNYPQAMLLALYLVWKSDPLPKLLLWKLSFDSTVNRYISFEKGGTLVSRQIRTSLSVFYLQIL